MKSKNSIIFPNHVSNAKFKLNSEISLTALEKNILYLIVDQLQNKMNKDLNQNFSEQKITNKQPRGRAVEVLNRNSFFISTQSVGELNPKND